MRDATTFEARLTAAFERYVEDVPIAVDAMAVAAAIAVAADRGPGERIRQVMSVRTTLRLVLIAALLAMLGFLLIQAGASRLPPPFGPAGNGLIAYGEANDVFLGDVRTGVSWPLLAGPEQDHDPAFSPDGRRVVVMRDVDKSSLNLVVANVDGSSVRRVTATPLSNLTFMDWAPDSRWIVVVSEIGDVQSLQLFGVDRDDPGRVLVNDINVISPMFRPPNGDEILFAGSSKGQVGLYVVRADGTGRRTLIPPRVTSNPDRDLVAARFAPDGRRIAVQTWSGRSGGEMRTLILDADATDGTGFELRHDPRAWYEGWPVWSPDGTRIAILRLLVAPNGSQTMDEQPVAIVPVDGPGPVTETGPVMSGDNRWVDWSPDGRYLITKSASDPELLLDPAGGPATSLPWTSTSAPSWQRVAP